MPPVISDSVDTIASTVRVPSQSFKIAAALGFSTSTPSGNSSTSASRAASCRMRVRAASRGTSWAPKEGISVANRSLLIQCSAGILDSVELHPQDITLEGQRRDRFALERARIAARIDQFQGMIRVSRRLGET
ncbi:MAG: hypothetical protein JWO42_1134 [Chloroflexi bacterium]|nr:hypothetical protein [Chloroflexota bacterium]